MHDTIVNNCCCYLAAKSSPTLLQLHGLHLARLLCPWDFPGKNSGGGCHCLLQRDLPNPGMEVASPALVGRLFTTEPLAKPTVNNALVHIQKSLRVNILRVCIICVLSHFSCVQTLCNPLDCSKPGSSVHGFSRQEYWSGLPSPPSLPRDLLDPGIKPVSLRHTALTGRFFTTMSIWEAQILRGLHHRKKEICSCDGDRCLLDMLVILQGVQMSNHYVLHLGIV